MVVRRQRVNPSYRPTYWMSLLNGSAESFTHTITRPMEVIHKHEYSQVFHRQTVIIPGRQYKGIRKTNTTFTCKNLQIYKTSYKYNNFLVQRLATGQSGDRIPVGGEILPSRPDRSRSPPSLLHNAYRVFPGGNAAEAWR